MHKSPKLPKELLNELGIKDGSGNNSIRRTIQPTQRSNERRAARIEKKRHTTHTAPLRKRAKLITAVNSNGTSNSRIAPTPLARATGQAITAKTVETIAEPPQGKYTTPLRPDLSRTENSARLRQERVPKPVANIFTKEDAEIRALERALGIKGKKGRSESHQEDELESFLDQFDKDSSPKPNALDAKTENWLQRKRQKARAALTSTLEGQEMRDSSDPGFLDSDTSELADPDYSIVRLRDLEDDPFEDSDDRIELKRSKPTKIRENPYVAPSASSGSTNIYIPPSLRAPRTSDQEKLAQLCRQTQGLLNRLSETNLLAIISNFEELYRENARQYISNILIELLIELLSAPAALGDTFFILHAGFIAALYKVIGMDFGAAFVQRIVEKFDQISKHQVEMQINDKRQLNLVSLLAQLYVFQVLGSTLIFDYIRLLLTNFSENETELLLRIVHISGTQLRHDDPTALRDIVLLLQGTIARLGADNVSVRTKFMIETINNLKNNRVKTGIAASTIMFDHTVRMKKILASLNTRNLRASEPLRIGLEDLEKSEKRGKWWLVGSSYRDDDQNMKTQPLQSSPNNRLIQDEFSDANITSAGLLQLAADHRMNTDVRRSIFVSIMSATDYRDAHIRLSKLRLRKAQEIEIPKILIQCTSAENTYNPFYTLIAQQLCADKKLKMAFQFSLWDLFKQMEESSEVTILSEDKHGGLDMRALVNSAKLFGSLVAERSLSLSILKTVDFTQLNPQCKTFVELLLITVIVHSQSPAKTGRLEKRLTDVFMPLNDYPDLVRSLQYFLKKVVRKTDVAGSATDTETVRWGCMVANDALMALTLTHNG